MTSSMNSARKNKTHSPSMDGDLLQAFKQNPYTHSLQSAPQIKLYDFDKNI